MRSEADRLRAAIDHLQFESQRGAARFFDVDERTLRRWTTGDRDIPLTVKMLVTLMIDRGVIPAEMPKLLQRRWK